MACRNWWFFCVLSDCPQENKVSESLWPSFPVSTGLPFTGTEICWLHWLMLLQFLQKSHLSTTLRWRQKPISPGLLWTLLFFSFIPPFPPSSSPTPTTRAPSLCWRVGVIESLIFPSGSSASPSSLWERESMVQHGGQISGNLIPTSSEFPGTPTRYSLRYHELNFRPWGRLPES